VEAVAARAERIAQHRGLQRPRQSERRGHRRTRERREGRLAGDAVGVQPRPVLELAEREVRVRPEDAVERPRRKAVAGQLELQGGDVPAGAPEP
jgi:hypothetical protein